jgi:hypothetical protein
VEAINPLTSNVIGASVAPEGTTTVTSLVLALVTVARTAPKKTTLFDATALKFEPARMTVSPTFPEIGLNVTIMGIVDIKGITCRAALELVVEPLPFVMATE